MIGSLNKELTQSRKCAKFAFELTDVEFRDLWSKFSTTKFSKTRINPRVFTEQGIYMLTTILKSKTAIDVTISIMRAFV